MSMWRSQRGGGGGSASAISDIAGLQAALNHLQAQIDQLPEGAEVDLSGLEQQIQQLESSINAALSDLASTDFEGAFNAQLNP